MEVQLATARLFNDESPRVGKLINELKDDSLTAPELVALMHQNGINVRHMGRLRSHVPTVCHTLTAN